MTKEELEEFSRNSEESFEDYKKRLYKIKFETNMPTWDNIAELLNEHQKSIFEDAIYNDLSLSEIADERGISRQGVHDMLKRVGKILEGYESKLHLVEKFQDTKEKVKAIDSLVDEFLDSDNLESIRKVKDISREILDDL